MIVKRLNKRIKTLGLGIQKLFALKENISDKWKKNKFIYPIPEGAGMLDKPYYKSYTVVWWIPEKIVNLPVSDFNIIVTDQFKDDVSKIISTHLLKRIDTLLDDFNNNYVFTDPDSRSMKYRDSDDPIFGGWDPCAHYLNKFQDINTDALPYSKSVNEQLRLTYVVMRPHKEGNKWVSDVIILGCTDHMYNGQRYSKVRGQKLTDNESNYEALKKARANMNEVVRIINGRFR